MRHFTATAHAVVSSNQFFVHDALANDTSGNFDETVFVFTFALIETKRFFVNVSGQMIGFNAHIRSLDAAFEQRPKVFDSVRVDIAFSISAAVIDDAMNIIRIQSDVARPFIADDFGLGFNGLRSPARQRDSFRPSGGFTRFYYSAALSSFEGWVKG